MDLHALTWASVRLGNKGQECHGSSAKSRDKTVPALLGQLLSDQPRKPCLSEGKTKHNTHTHALQKTLKRFTCNLQCPFQSLQAMSGSHVIFHSRPDQGRAGREREFLRDRVLFHGQVQVALSASKYHSQGEMCEREAPP